MEYVLISESKLKVMLEDYELESHNLEAQIAMEKVFACLFSNS